MARDASGLIFGMAWICPAPIPKNPVHQSCKINFIPRILIRLNRHVISPKGVLWIKKKKMEAQQIRLNINELAAGIQDEAILIAFLEAMKGIEKAYHNLSKQSNGATTKKKAQPKNGAAKEATTLAATTQTLAKAGVEAEKPLPHDLSLVLLANEVFKGSEPLPEEAILAFDDAMLESALKEPTLPYRL